MRRNLSVDVEEGFMEEEGLEADPERQGEFLQAEGRRKAF